jgi:hypothetical protein
MSKLPTLRPSLLDYLTEQKRNALRQASSSAFARSGTSVTAEGVVTVAGAQQSADFDGDLAAGDAGTTGWALNAARAAFGALFLRPGSIENDSLVSPVASDIVNFTDTGFAVTTAWSDAAATTITVPAGFTQLLATCTAGAFAVDPNTTGGSNGTGGDALDCHVLLNGSTSAGFAWGMSGSNGFTSSSSSGSFKFTGLTPGATLQISTQVLALYQALGSNVANKATINATLIWLR